MGGSGALRIALATSYWEEGSWDLETVLLRSLAEGLEERGHRIEVFTTTSSAPTPTYAGGLIWNRCYREGVESEGRRTVNRFTPQVTGKSSQASPHRPRRAWWGGAHIAEELAVYCSRALPASHGIAAGGWYEYEMWSDGPGRWSHGEGVLLLWGDGLERIELRVLSPLAQVVEIKTGGSEKKVPFAAGEEKRVAVAVVGGNGVPVFLRPERTYRPAADRRVLGIGLREVRVKDAAGWHEVSLQCDLASPPQGYWENIPYSLVMTLTSLSGGMEKLWRNIVGPRSRGLRRAMEERAGEYDLILAARARHYTACIAGRAARKAEKPLVLVPLLSSEHILGALPFLLWQLGHAGGVADPQPLWEVSMREMGKPFFHLPPPALFPTPLDVCEGEGLEEWSARIAGEGGTAGAVALGVEGSPQVKKRVLDVLRCGKGASLPRIHVLLGTGGGAAATPAYEELEKGDERTAGDPRVWDFSGAPLPLQRLVLRAAESYCQVARCEDWGWKLCLSLAGGKRVIAPAACPLAANIVEITGMGDLCGDTASCVRALTAMTAAKRERGPVKGNDGGRASEGAIFRAIREKFLDDFADWLACLV